MTTIAEILAATAAWHGLTPADLRSQRRARAVSRPRQIAMYLAKQLTELSYPAIGRVDRDHTTVMYGVRRVEELVLEGDVSVLAAIASIGLDLTPRYTAARWPTPSLTFASDWA